MNNRLLAIALGGVAVALLIFSSFSHRWLFNSARNEEVGFGLRDYYTCQSDGGETTMECRQQSNSVNVFGGDVSGAFVPMGWATFIECLVAALGLLGALAIAIAGKRPDPPIAPTTISLLAIMACLITGCIFVATQHEVAAGVGFGFWAFGGGAVLGLAASLMLSRVNRPIDPDLMEDAMNPDQF